MSSSPLALYRSLLRLSRQLPDDTARFASFRGHVVSRARNAIRAHREATGADREQLLKNGWKEYDALKAILGNKTRDEVLRFLVLLTVASS